MKHPPRKTSHTFTRPPARTSLAGYATLLSDLKHRIRTAQIRAALSVNRELIQLYWDIGRVIVAKQKQEGWGTAVIDKLAADLQREFTDLSGFSRTNIYRMRAFYAAYGGESAIVPEPLGQLPSGQEPSQFVARPARQSAKKPARPIVPEPLGQLSLSQPPEPMASLPWSHNIALIESISKNNVRLWYARKALENGWSHNMLAHWINSDLYSREGKAVTNFKTTLPPAQSDLALQILKDPYNFDFLTLHHDAKEKDLETGLLEHITRFLIELGEGFAFVGRQMRFEVDGEDFAIDLLFYHVRLHAFVVIDLKTGKFLPEHAGKMNFYLSMIDDQMRSPQDAPTIGLILCRTRSKIIAEYALRHTHRPVGIAGYQLTLTNELPKEFAGSLPTIKQIERELSRPSKPSPRQTRSIICMEPTMHFHVGTSGYSYKEWKPSFYPQDLPQADMLPFYARHFAAVEINGSFYRLPTAATIKSWTQQVPGAFQFVLKSPQTITHFKRLNDPKATLKPFLQVAAHLKARRGPLYFQLPGNFKKDLSRLEAFLAVLKKAPSSGGVTFEFRHASWFDDETFALLRKHACALCINDSEDSPFTDIVSTANWGYLRLRRGKYTDAQLKTWIKKIRQHPWTHAYIFFMHEDTGTGPKFATRFLKLVEESGR